MRYLKLLFSFVAKINLIILIRFYKNRTNYILILK